MQYPWPKLAPNSSTNIESDIIKCFIEIGKKHYLRNVQSTLYIMGGGYGYLILQLKERSTICVRVRMKICFCNETEIIVGVDMDI